MASYPINFPESQQLVADVSKIDPLSVLRMIGMRSGELDGILGGPPCQGFSYMGNRDLNDPRNGLIWHFFKFVKFCFPKFFVMENVPGLVTHPFIHKLNAGLELVTSDYRIVGPIILNAADFGAATKRPRVFVIGYRKQFVDSISEADIHAEKIGFATVYQAIGDLPELSSATPDSSGHYWARYREKTDTEPLDEYAKQARKEPPSGLSSLSQRKFHAQGFVSGFAPTRHTHEVTKRFASVPQGKTDKVSRCTRLAWDAPCVVLRAGTGKEKGSYQSVRPIHPEENRVISVREAARIQGFPDWFQFHHTKWHSFRMIGNSVSPYAAKAILKIIARRICTEMPNR